MKNTLVLFEMDMMYENLLKKNFDKDFDRNNFYLEINWDFLVKFLNNI